MTLDVERAPVAAYHADRSGIPTPYMVNGDCHVALVGAGVAVGKRDQREIRADVFQDNLRAIPGRQAMAVQIQGDRHFSVDGDGLGQVGIPQEGQGRSASALGGAAGDLREGSAYTGEIGHIALKGHAGHDGNSAIRALRVSHIRGSLVAALGVAVDAIAVDILAMLALHDLDITEVLELVIVPVVFRAVYRLEGVFGVQQAAQGDIIAGSVDNILVGAACQDGSGSRTQFKVTDTGVAALLNGQVAIAIQHDCVQRSAEVGFNVQHSPAGDRQCAAVSCDGAALVALDGQNTTVHDNIGVQGERVAMQVQVNVMAPVIRAAVDSIGQQLQIRPIIGILRCVLQNIRYCVVEPSLFKEPP